ncbi:MAG: 4'-phosphopantetheinyl transferase family protein [Shimia sp.]|jgi:4'-phosphopantetheinyl transferase EntD|uniref:4'-phosphopantetheinyl transferase family protein n=1 Tax=Shimia sp. TaxID=1954381 RepID=UPI004059E74B
MTIHPSHLSELRQMAQTFAPRGMGVGVADPTQSPALVLPEEAVAIAAARPKRKREFAAGRRAARSAMQKIGLSAAAVPSGPNRAPAWPAGVTGSISHDDSSALAVVAPLTRFRALGVDIEPNAPLPRDVYDAITTRNEQAALAQFSDAKRLHLGRHIFCAKEAVFKAQFPLTHQMFGFHEVEITFNTLHTGFRARFMRNIATIRAGSTLSGQCGYGGGHVLAMVTLGAVHGTENANFPVCATG